MKTIYTIMIFLAIFQVTVILVNSLGVFPDDSTFYSDIESSELQKAGNNPSTIFSKLFVPSDTNIAGFSLSSGSIIAVIILIATLGTGIAIFTQSFVPAILAIQGILFVPMITNSMTFFTKLFRNFNSNSLTYLAVTIGVGFLIILLITVVETPTHGRS